MYTLEKHMILVLQMFTQVPSSRKSDHVRPIFDSDNGTNSGSSIVLHFRYGRKLIFIFCIILMSITGVAQAVSPNYTVFQIFVFVNALGTSGVYPLAFILGIQMKLSHLFIINCLL